MIDWNQRYKNGDTPWEKGQAAPPLIELLDQTSRDIWGDGEILVPGCGTGHDVRALAKIGLQVCGLDLAEEALHLANKHPKIQDEHYAIGDFLDPSWRAEKRFSAIWEHTCFCAIDPQERSQYAQACAELLESGDRLVAVFFLNPFDLGEERDGPPHPTSKEELDRYFSPYFQLEKSWTPQKSYVGREGREWLAIYRRK